MKKHSGSKPQAIPDRGHMSEQAVGKHWPQPSSLDQLASDIRSLVNSGLLRHDEIAGEYLPLGDRIQALKSEAQMHSHGPEQRRLDVLFGLMAADEAFWHDDHADMLERLALADDMLVVRASKRSEEQEEWNRKLSKQLSGTYELSSAPGTYHSVALALARLGKDVRKDRMSRFAAELRNYRA